MSFDPSADEAETYLASLKESKICRCDELSGTRSLLQQLIPHFGSHAPKYCRGRGRESLPLNLEKDSRLICGILRLVGQDADHKNLFRWIAELVRVGKFRAAYGELDKIYGVADKVASFIPRDIYLLHRLEGRPRIEAADDQWTALFAVDTWVNSNAGRLGVPLEGIRPSKRYDEIKRYFVERCRDGVGTPKYDPPRWQLGFGIWAHTRSSCW